MKVISLPKIRNDQIMAQPIRVSGLEIVAVPDDETLDAMLPTMEGIILGDAATYTAELAARLRARAGRLRRMQLVSAGDDGFDTHGVLKGVTVTGNGGALSVPVAEHAMAFLLALTSCVHIICARQACRSWKMEFVGSIGRGELIDTPALLGALRQGTLGGAALDVTDPESLPAGHPLWCEPNVIISPRVAGGGSPRSFERIAMIAAENAKRLLTGEAQQELLFCGSGRANA